MTKGRHSSWPTPSTTSLVLQRQRRTPALDPAQLLIYLLRESALMKYVLDSSALLSGKEFEGELFIVPGVQRELRKYGVTPQLAAFLDTKVRVLSPAKEAITQIQNKAKETGDDRRLSPVDMDLLALASELSATLVTDDYSIENLAKALGIPYDAVSI